MMPNLPGQKAEKRFSMSFIDIIHAEGIAMAKERKSSDRIALTSDVADHDRSISIQASPPETGEYVAQMSTELMSIAKSSTDYIATMASELSTLTRSARLERLTVLLELVCREARSSTV